MRGPDGSPLGPVTAPSDREIDEGNLRVGRGYDQSHERQAAGGHRAAPESNPRPALLGIPPEFLKDLRLTGE